jgi:signal transduction histidine kinase
MTGALRSSTRRGRLHLPAPTARLRLTLLYAGMFLALGTALILIIYVLATGGAPIHLSGSGAVSVAPTPAAVPGTTGGPPAVRAAPLGGIPDLVVRQRSADLNRLLEVSWLVLAVTAMASAALGWIAAGRVLRPVREMTATARTISAGTLSERLAVAGLNDEFKRLGDTLDDLLARLEGSFEAQRRFVANASHELRTPLTVERTLLQVALADPHATAGTLRAACEELLLTGEEQERLLEALLTLASSERGLDRREPLDLATIAGQALLAADAEVERRGLRSIVTLDPAPTIGDPQLIERLIANLLGNAIEYNDAGGLVELRTGRDPQRSILTIANTGPRVSPEEAELLFEPFQRLGGGRAAQPDGHHGLGLSIVRAIATAHGGGLTVEVSFPAA